MVYNTKNLKPYYKGEIRARENGRKGGIQSGIVRRRNAEARRSFEKHLEIQNFIDSLTDEEYKDFVADFTEEQQNEIRFRYRPTKEDTKKWNKILKQYFK